MKNIKNFKEYNVNEGLIDSVGPFLSKKFKPGQIDDIMKWIQNDIENNFDINKLKKVSIPSTRLNKTDQNRTVGEKYEYTTSKGDMISFHLFSNKFYINDDEVSDLVNPYYLKDIKNLLIQKDRDRNKTDQSNDKSNDRKSRASDIRNKYASKYMK